MPFASYTRDKCPHHHDLPTFLQRLRGDLDMQTAIVRLELGNAAERNDPLPTDRISLCTLKELLVLLPKLESFLLHDVFFIRCDDPNHDINGHVPSPPAATLRTLHLRRISIIPPFDVDLLSIVHLAPQLRTLEVSSCYALPDIASTDVTNVGDAHPPLTLPEEPLFPDEFRILRLEFPDRAERARYHMELPWYDFTRRLSTDRGTILMVLKNVHDACSVAVKELLDDDGSTLEQLSMEFEPDFQNSSSRPWTHVPLEDCNRLKIVKFCLPMRLILANGGPDTPPSPLPFTTFGNLVRKIPDGVSKVILKLLMLDEDFDDKHRVLEAMPWAIFDQHFTAHRPRTTLVIHMAMDWPSPRRQVVKNFICSSMENTVARGKLLLSPKGWWKV